MTLLVRNSSKNSGGEATSIKVASAKVFAILAKVTAGTALETALH